MSTDVATEPRAVINTCDPSATGVPIASLKRNWNVLVLPPGTWKLAGGPSEITAGPLYATIRLSETETPPVPRADAFTRPISPAGIGLPPNQSTVANPN